MTDLEQRIWAWLPARSDRRRVTQPAVCAAALDVTLDRVMSAYLSMEQAGHIIPDRRGWHRGLPC